MTAHGDSEQGRGRMAMTGIALLEQAGSQAPVLTDLDLDPLVFDPDARRRGAFGGFFLADDSGAENYLVPNAPEGAEWARRYNGPGRDIPGVHLPASLRFALVAAGPLMKTAKPGQDPQFRFEAAVFCDQVIDRRTGRYAMLRLVISGVPAVKLHNFLALDINEPLCRLTKRLHEDTRRAFRAGRISRTWYEAAMGNSATAQFIWAPVSVKACQPLGKYSSTLGAMPYVEFKPRQGDRYLSMWTRVSTDSLATPDEEGGLLLTGWVQEECESNHPRFQRILRERAAWKERHTRTTILTPPRPNPPAAPSPSASD